MKVKIGVIHTYLVVCLLVILSSSFSSVTAQQKNYDTLPYILDHHRARLAQFAKEPVVKGKIIFLGNSITEGGQWKKLLKDSTVINRGISGDVTFGVLKRLEDIIQREPSKVFLLIGINDISKNIPDEVILENIFSIVRKLKGSLPKTSIYVQSILPTNNSFKNTLPQHYNKDEHVIIINSQLMRYAEKIGFTYVDIYTPFQNKEGKLDARYTYDGLHLNNIGYEHWASILKNLKLL